MKEIEIIKALKDFKVAPKLDNGQLKLIGDVKNLPADIIADVKANKDKLLDFLTESNKNAIAIEKIPKIETAEYYPLSNAQKRIWVLSQFDGGNEAYNIPEIFHLRGNVNWANFEAAIRFSIERHESLRTGFKVVNNEPVQIINETVDFKLEIEALSILEGLENAVKKIEEKYLTQPFDLEKAPLFWVKIFQVNEEESILMVNMHHIISDGWSAGVLVQEILQNYTNLSKGIVDKIPELDIQYKDYNQWLNNKIEGNFGEEAKTFWKNKNFNSVENINLPIDFPRPVVNDFEGGALKFYFDKDKYAQLEDLAKGQKTTLFNVFRAILGISLHKWTNQNKIVIGTPVAGRLHAQLENQIGLYVNTLPLLTQMNSELDFSAYLNEISKDSLDTFKFQDYPLDLILEEENIIRDTSRNPLFDVMMVVQNNQISDGSMDISQQHGFVMNYFGDLLTEEKTFKPDVTSKFDLSFNFSHEKEKGPFVEIEYKAKLFKKSTIQTFYNLFLFVTEQVLQNQKIDLKEIEILNPKEKEILLEQFNQTIQEHAEGSLIELLDDNLKSKGDQTALIVGQKTFSYDNLDREANKIANALTEIKSNKVGILIDRSEKVLYSVLGALKANKTYVPIDIAYPAERIAYILDDAQIETILVDGAGNTCIPENFNGTVLNLDQLDQKDVFEIKRENLQEKTAYLIYTSGSTGKPKGVEISNKNAIAFLKWADKEFENTPYKTLFAGTSYCFDLSVFEIFLPLLQGKTIRLLKNATEISDFILKDENILINTVPSVVRNLLDLNVNWKNVSALNMAGEPVPRIFKEQLDYEQIEIRNLYGPSEDTTYSTFYRFKADGLNYVPIGKAVGDTHVYILNDELQLLPIGVEGEIYLSGESVAKGYYNKPTLTAGRFLNNPFIEGKKLYKTGDIGKWSSQGQLEFIGRTDDQVKVRGYRIELGEIQHQLEQIPQIKQAVVIIKALDDEKEIVAYYELSEPLDATTIKKQLEVKLPIYMVPSILMELQEVPMNANGKVDKKQLPSPKTKEGKEIVPPKNENQKELLAIWEQVLKTKEIGITSNFFDLGGHSLKATQLRSYVASSLLKDLTLNEIFQHPTIIEQSELLDKKATNIESKIETVSTADDNAYPLSFAQERLWILNNFEEVSKAYHMPAAFEVFGGLEFELLEKALNKVVKKHESLRTVFREINGIAKQVILSINDVKINIVQQNIAASLSLKEAILEDWGNRFDLETGPLLRVSIWKQGNRKILSFNMHHIISDGWSVAVLSKEVLKAYNDLLNGEDNELSALNIQYKDFAIWQRNELTPEVLTEQLGYWKNEVFANGIENLELPYDRPRPSLKTYNGSTINHLFSKSLSNAIKKQALDNGASLFMGIMANVNVLLKKLANRNDITVGIPIVGRESSQLEEQIGFFINTLPIRTELSGTQKFTELLTLQRQNLLKAFEYQHFPFEKLVDEIQPKRDMSRSPLFDVLVTLQNFDVVDQSEIELENETRFSRLEFETNYTKYDLTFSFTEQNGLINLEFEYNTDLFDHSTIEKMIKQLCLVFEATTSSPEIKIEAISIISEAEQTILFSKSDQTHVAYDKEETILTRFQKSVETYPERIALKVGDKEITFKELDERSGKLAAILHQKYKVEIEDLIILHTDRSEWMLVSILATLKAGAAYVPVDPQYPLKRIGYIIEDSNAKLLLTDQELRPETASLAEQVEVINMTKLSYSEETYTAPVKANNLAYIIYTSGTTGNPKGVLIEHENVNRLLFNTENRYDFNENDVWPLFHSYCFDVSVWEMYCSLLNGGKLVMVPKDIAQNSLNFFDFLAKEEVTVLNQTPTAFRGLTVNNHNRFDTTPLAIRYVIFAGEALSPIVLEDWHKAYPNCKLINMYGITETTVHVTYKEIGITEIETNQSNIGVPLPTLSCYVLDVDLKPTSVGVTGELYVGGAGVGRGYHNKPELTADRFLQSPFNETQRMYKSGDFAKILANGDLEYIGRKDDQVKIRGHRIELSEVESGMLGHKDVKDVVIVTLKTDGGDYELIAYVILNDPGIDTPNFRVDLEKNLPAYMIPTQYITLEEFPLTHNGKLDKKALPSPNDTDLSKAPFVEARNEIDKRIIKIWEEVLDRDKIGIKDNFFDLGGHSLKATRVISKIQEEFGVKIDLKDLFTDATIENLSNYVDTVSWMNNQGEVESKEDELIL